MTEMTVAVSENKELTSFTDVVVIRPSEWSSEDGVKDLVSKLSLKGFLPVMQPHHLPYWDEDSHDKWFPTDSFRDLGSIVLVNHPHEFANVLRRIQPILGPAVVNRLRQKAIDFELAGAHYLHLNDQKEIFYDVDYIDNSGWISEDGADKIKKQLERMRTTGWQIYPIHHGDFLLGDRVRPDFDFVYSIFLGKGNKIHGLIHPALADRIPLDIQTHQLPEKEIEMGGANVADLRGGRVLVCANSKDAPIAFELLTKYARAEIIEAPSHYVDNGGGPRCSIASFSLS